MNKHKASKYLGVSVRTLQRIAAKKIKQKEYKAKYERGSTGQKVAVFDTDTLDKWKAELEAVEDSEITPARPVAPEVSNRAISDGTPGTSQSLAIRQPRDLQSLLALLESSRAPSVTDLAHKLMLSLDEAAGLSGLSRGHLREAMRAGKLKGESSGGALRSSAAILMLTCGSFEFAPHGGN